jgi:hypothetical protein
MSFIGFLKYSKDFLLLATPVLFIKLLRPYFSFWVIFFFGYFH